MAGQQLLELRIEVRFLARERTIQVRLMAGRGSLVPAVEVRLLHLERGRGGCTASRRLETGVAVAAVPALACSSWFASTPTWRGTPIGSRGSAQARVTCGFESHPRYASVVEGETRQLEVLVPARGCRFESCRVHGQLRRETQRTDAHERGGHMPGKHAKPRPVVPHVTCPPHQPVRSGTDENGQPKCECLRCGNPCRCS